MSLVLSPDWHKTSLVSARRLQQGELLLGLVCALGRQKQQCRVAAARAAGPLNGACQIKFTYIFEVRRTHMTHFGAGENFIRVI